MEWKISWFLSLAFWICGDKAFSNKYENPNPRSFYVLYVRVKKTINCWLTVSVSTAVLFFISQKTRNKNGGESVERRELELARRSCSWLSTMILQGYQLINSCSDIKSDSSYHLITKPIDKSIEAWIYDTWLDRSFSLSWSCGIFNRLFATVNYLEVIGKLTN